MPLASCPRCRKMFNKTTAQVCPACQADEKADQDRVRAVLDENPNLNAEALAERAEVSIGVVERMMTDGSLTILNLTENLPKCGRCGAPAISMSKRLCQACLEKLNAEVAQMQRQIRLGDKPEAKIGTYDNRLNVVETVHIKRKE